MIDFELFSLLYFALDAQYDEQKTKDEELGQFLSEINPFLWKEESSADPAYFVEFQQFMKDKQIGDDYGYALALEYLMTEKFYEGIPQYFSKISKEEWIESAKSYLAEPHKGGGK